MTDKIIKNLIFVDCEGHGPAPTLNDPVGFEFGAVAYPSRQTFHGTGATKETFESFDKWISSVIEKGFRPLFVSDNPAYDWQFINYYFHLHLGKNPFGHSARRIGDFYAGCGSGRKCGFLINNSSGLCPGVLHFWSTRWVMVSNGQTIYSRYKARHKGKQWVKIGYLPAFRKS